MKFKYVNLFFMKAIKTKGYREAIYGSLSATEHKI